MNEVNSDNITWEAHNCLQHIIILFVIIAAMINCDITRARTRARAIPSNAVEL